MVDRSFIVYKKKRDRFYADKQSLVMGTIYTDDPHLSKNYKTISRATQRLFSIYKLYWTSEEHILNWCVQKKYYFNTDTIRKMKIDITEGNFGLKEVIDAFGIVYTAEYSKDTKFPKLTNSNDKVFEYLNSKILNKQK